MKAPSLNIPAELLIATVREALVVLDADMRILSANRSFYRTFQVTPEETEGQRLYDVGNQQWDIPALRELLERILPGQTAMQDFEVEHDFETLGERVMLLNALQIRSAPNKEQVILLDIEDITARKTIERERERLLEELEAKNAELERFTYTVSHDLKSPLMTIKGFLGLLEKDVAVGNAERVKKDMEHISSAADKMHRLLDELLELSRIGHVVSPPVAVSLTDLAREAASLVAGQIAERGVAVEIAPEIPVVYGDPMRLLVVLQNLLENAVKYMGDQPVPHIEVRGTQDGNQVVCQVRDNGMGIEPRYHDAVFGLFERLDTTGEGTGIGLALVRRIVEGHGGRIWVESEGQGRGATFSFTLPGRR